MIECNCSICIRRGHLLFFVPREKLQLSTPEADMATYTFKSHTIKHHFCPTCGCAPFGEGPAPGSGAMMAAVNARCIEGIELSKLNRQFFDGRSI